MKNIKQFLRNVILFLSFTVVLYIVFVISFYKILPLYAIPNVNYRIGSYGHLHSRINEIKKFKNIDVLFLGSSHTYRGFDTRVFEKNGYQCFNLGSSSQTPIQTEVLLERYLDDLNPKIVIFEVSPIVFSLDGVESSLDIIANDRNDLLTIRKLIKWDNIKTINTAIIGFWRDLLGIHEKFTEDPIKGDDTYVSGGFVEKTLKYYNPQHIDKQDIKIKDIQIKALEQCLNIIKSRNIKLILIRAPISKTLYASYINPQYFDTLMSKYGKYYNYNGLVNLEDSLHFTDPSHLNQQGVEIFDNEIITLLNTENVE